MKLLVGTPEIQLAVFWITGWSSFTDKSFWEIKKEVFVNFLRGTAFEEWPLAVAFGADVKAEQTPPQLKVNS